MKQSTKPLLSVTLLCAALNTAFAQTSVSNEAEYNAALKAGNDINITQGFAITAMPGNPIGDSIDITGTGSSGNDRPVLNGNGGNWHAFTSYGSSYSLEDLSNIAIENFGNVAVWNIADPFMSEMTLDNVHFRNNVHNAADDDQGGGAVVTYTMGQVRNSTFTGNRVSGSGSGGGALAVYTNMSGNINNSKFESNAAEGGGGAVAVFGSMGSIVNSTFTGNTATSAGGAVYATSSGGISESNFIDNSGKQGGALYIDRDGLKITAANFIANRTHTSSDEYEGNGGAVYVGGGDVNVMNGVFLGNRAQGGTEGGMGGAIYSTSNTDWNVTIAADGTGGRSLFYGNQHRVFGPNSSTSTLINEYNAVALFSWGSDAKTAKVTFNAAGPDSLIAMLDPFAISGGTESLITKTGDGVLALGGNNTFGTKSTWSLDDGWLALTTVDYGAGAVGATIDLQGPGSSFTLADTALLAGSGTIKAPTITLNGTLNPLTVVNTGTLASNITKDTQAEEVGLNISSDYGTLKFEGNVTLSGSYMADVGAGGSSDVIEVANGELILGSTARLVVRPRTEGTFEAVVVRADSMSSTFAVDAVEIPTLDFLTASVTADYGTGREVKVSGSATLKWDEGDNTTANSTFALDAGQTFSVTSALKGDDKILTKSGDGTLFLNGANTYTGDTTVSAGTLRVGEVAGSAASVVSKVIVQSGATVGGHGRFAGGLTMNPGAWIAPGASIGTMTVVGDLDLSGVTYDYEISPDGSADLLKVEGGKVKLDGDSKLVISQSGTGVWAANRTYTVIDAAGGIDSEFEDGNVFNTLTFLDHKLEYDGNLLKLLMTRNSTSLESVAGTRNQRGVAAAIAALPAGELKTAVEGLSGEASIRAAYDNLSGEMHASARSAVMGNQRLRNMVQARMLGLGAGVGRSAAAQPVMLASNGSPRVGLSGAPSQRLWANTWGYSGDTDGNRNVAKTDHSGIGLAFGGDARVSDTLALGAVFGYEDGKVKAGGTRRSRTDVDAYSLGGYLTTQAGAIALQGGVIYSHLDFDASRNVTVGGAQGKAKASYKGRKVQAFVEGSRAFDAGESLTFTPYLNLTQSWLHTDKAREKGSIAALTTAAQNDSVFQTTLGLRSAYALPTATPVAVTANLGWAHSFGDTRVKTRNRFNAGGTRFAIAGTRIDRDRALVGVGLEASLAPNTTLAVGYDGQFGSNLTDHAGSVQVRVRF